jgi:hypothetical protein
MLFSQLKPRRKSPGFPSSPAYALHNSLHNTPAGLDLSQCGSENSISLLFQWARYIDTLVHGGEASKQLTSVGVNKMLWPGDKREDRI